MAMRRGILKGWCSAQRIKNIHDCQWQSYYNFCIFVAPLKPASFGSFFAGQEKNIAASRNYRKVYVFFFLLLFRRRELFVHSSRLWPLPPEPGQLGNGHKFIILL